MNKIKNIAILAHADAGKTTITEQFLFLSGAIKKAGSVDAGTTQTDNLPVEKERGISVRSSITSFIWKSHQINLIDTPGHVDFSSEVEKILPVIDGAILVLSAVEGIQSHTETIFSALKEYKIPTLFFINKIDRIGANSLQLIDDIKKELTRNIFPIQHTHKEESNDAELLNIWNENNYVELLDILLEKDDNLLGKYLDGQEVTFKEAEFSLKRAIYKSEIYPVLFGSAKNQTGIEDQ